MNNRGHADWSGLAYLFILCCMAILFVEGGLIAATIIWWRYMTVRLVFGILSIAGLFFIVKTAIDLWD